jgi:hypothetical protein
VGRIVPALAEVDAAELFGVERTALSFSEKAGYKKTALFLIAMLFDRFARKTEAPKSQSGSAYSAICATAIDALTVDDWNKGAQTLEVLVDMCWRSQLLQ